MQVIYDLLVPNSAELPLREDPVLGAVPSGLTRVTVTTARDVLRLLEDGNSRRKTERTDANACSSRSHAVFEVRLFCAPSACMLPSSGIAVSVQMPTLMETDQNSCNRIKTAYRTAPDGSNFQSSSSCSTTQSYPLVMNV